MTRRIFNHAGSTLMLAALLSGCAQAPNYAPVQTVNQALKPVTGNEDNSTAPKPNNGPEPLHLPAAKILTSQQNSQSQQITVNAKSFPPDSKAKNNLKSQLSHQLNKAADGHQTSTGRSDTISKQPYKNAVSTPNRTPSVRNNPPVASLPIQASPRPTKSLPLTVESLKSSKNPGDSPHQAGIAAQKISVKEQKKLAKAPLDTKNSREEKSIISIDNKKMLKLNFDWPLLGKITRNFSQTGQKGIDITGKNGQSVHAAESGKAVYCGQGLKGFGNLAIIKHNETYLSAYAHNRVLYIKEGQKITKGQKIGQVGESGPQKASLHFEIRKNGKPINPLSLLPNN